MVAGILLGLLFLSLLAYFVHSIRSRGKSPGDILKEELTSERRRRERIQASIESVRALNSQRIAALTHDIEEMLANLPDREGVRLTASEEEIRLQIGEVEFRITHVFRDIADWRPEEGRYLVQRNAGPSDEIPSRDEAIRLLARELARLTE